MADRIVRFPKRIEIDGDLYRLWPGSVSVPVFFEGDHSRKVVEAILDLEDDGSMVARVRFSDAWKHKWPTDLSWDVEGVKGSGGTERYLCVDALVVRVVKMEGVHGPTRFAR